MAEYDQFEKIFCGTWKHDRDEKMEELMDHLKTPEEARKISRAMKPALILKRSGKSFTQTWQFAPNMGIDNTIVFGQEYESKDPDEPKKWHTKAMPTFDGKEYKQVVKSQLPPPQNTDYISMMTVNGDELTNAVTGITDQSVVGKTIFKRS